MITAGPPCGLLNDPMQTQANDCPCLSDDLWQISDQLNEENLTLAIVGIEPNVIVCDDFYSALAKNTGPFHCFHLTLVERDFFRRRIHSIDQC